MTIVLTEFARPRLFLDQPRQLALVLQGAGMAVAMGDQPRHKVIARRARDRVLTRRIDLGDVVPADLKRFGEDFGERKLARHGADRAIIEESEKRLDSRHILGNRLDRIDEDIGVSR